MSLPSLRELLNRGRGRNPQGRPRRPKTRQNAAPHRRWLVPRLEILEDRTLLSSVLTVVNTNDSGAGSLRDTINAAASGDKIVFDPHLSGPITLTSGELRIDKSLDIEGPGADRLTVQRSAAAGTPAFRIFTVDNPGGPIQDVTVTIAGLTISNGQAVAGGGIDNQATLTVADCTLSGNSAGIFGGGIWNEGVATLTVTNTTLSGNSASEGGGINNGGTLTLTNSTLAGNSARVRGGGIENLGELMLTHDTLSGNLAPSGGGIENVEGTLTLTNCTLADNGDVHTNEGGGIENEAVARLTNCTLSRNFATEGGGIRNQDMLTLTNCTLADNNDINTFTEDGGGIENEGVATLTNCTLSGNNAVSGGGINNVEGTLTLTNCTLSGNTAAFGGGIKNIDGTLTLTNCTLHRNMVGDDGGGIDNIDGTLTLTNCTLSDNQTISGPGAGIANEGGMLTLTNCTLANNSTFEGGGGGIANRGTLTLTNCTLYLNFCGGDGGGILNDAAATLTVANTIIAGNNASSGRDVRGVVTSRGYNLIGDGTRSNFVNGVNGDQVGTSSSPLNPLLGPLQDNGGPTFTMALLPGSLARGAGSTAWAVGPDGAPLTTDQRSFARVVDGTVDIGAFEVQHYVVTTTADAGPGSLRDAVTNADRAGGSDITFAVRGAITLQSALPDIFRSTRVLGPGANVLTVQRDKADTRGFRLFTVDSPADPIQDVTVTLAGLTLANGLSPGGGGGISNGATLTVAGCVLDGNSAFGGGGIFNAAKLTVTGSTLSDNSAGLGGGIYNAATLTMAGSTLSGNTAAFGGGIDNAGTPSLTHCTLTNCTLAGNTITQDGGGIDNAGTLTLTDCTVAGNSASRGGGAFNAGTLTLANTILAGNTAPSGPDVSGAVTSRGHNLIGDPSGGSGFDSTDRQGTPGSPLDAGLAPLGKYGGPTATMALLPGSPAIDQGDNRLVPAGVTTDQRGFARISGPAVDIGAFEVQDLVINLDVGENVRLQSDASPGLLDVVFSNSSRPNFTIDVTTRPAILINGSANNEVDLEDVPAGIGFTVKGGTGSMTVDVTPTVQDIGHIQGAVAVHAGGGPATVSLNDQAATTSNTYLLDATTFRRTGFGGLSYGGLGSLTVNMAHGIPLGNYQSNQNLYVLATPAEMTTKIHADNGWDNVSVGLPTDPQLNPLGLPGSPLDNIRGPVTIIGQGYQGVLNLWDWDSSTAVKSYDLNSTSIVATPAGGPASAPISWQGTLSVVALFGSWAADKYLLRGEQTNLAALVVDGGYRANTFQSQLPNRHTWAIYNNGAVGTSSSPGHNVIFGEVWNLTGGPGGDVFQFQPSYGVNGKIDGVLNANGGTLDYSQSVGDVTVDLPLQLASQVDGGAAGGARNVASVIGSQGNDLLVGDDNANVLRGGTGRNLIIGGKGPDQLYGGGGDNLLIGGFTSYDQDLVALDALFAEWTSADPLDVRMGDILSGGGRNGNFILNPVASGGHPATVFDDGAADLLFDGTGLSWFFVHPPDDLINNGAGPQVSGDVVTLIP
jgi:hypothetical protein